MLDARARGHVKAVGCSGQGAPLAWALASGAFDGVQVAVNVVDHEGLRMVEKRHDARPLRVMAKRPLASRAFLPVPEHGGDDRKVLRARWEQAGLGEVIDEREGAATLLRWALGQPPVDDVLVGTASVVHLEEALAAAAAGPLDGDRATRIEAAVAPYKASWPGVI